MPGASDPLDLPDRGENMFCFAIYSASHVINRAYTPFLKPLGITYPQYMALTFLWDGDGQGVGQLASRMKMETSTLTPLIKRLEQQGHVVRKRGVEDERQVFVYLTEQGAELKSKAPEITACMIDSTGLKLKELDELVSQLQKISTNVAKG